MSGNNFNTKEKENVEAVTESTAPVRAPTSAYVQSNSSRFLLQSEDDSTQMTEVNVSFEETSRGDMTLASNADGTVASVDSTPDLGLGDFLSRPGLS